MSDQSGGFTSETSLSAALSEGPSAVPSDPNASASGPAVAAAPSGQEPDISRSTIVILVVLTLLISILGTWTVLNEAGTIRIATKQPTPSTADVRLTVMSEQEYLASHQPQQGLATGKVALTILG